jgi:hypothetical protein
MVAILALDGLRERRTITPHPERGAGRFVMKTRKHRVFVSFDFDNDQVLKDFLAGQATNDDSTFEVTDHSLKEAAPEKDWETKAKAAIGSADSVLIMLGSKTHEASGVLKEVKMAREAKKSLFQIIGYKDGDYTAVPNGGSVYKWSWPDLKKLLPPVTAE